MHDPIEAVLFDYGLVLTGSPDSAAWARMQSVTGATEEPFAVAYWRHRLPYDRGELTGRAYWHTVGEDLGRTLAHAELDALIAADTALWTQINQPMVDWAMRLQAAGTATGILSNLGDEMTHGVLAALPWLAGFTFRLWSHTVLLTKPEPAIYAHAVTGLGIAPERILFVDDRADNIAGALAVGLQAIRYLDQRSFEQELAARGLTELWRTGRQDISPNPAK